MLAQQKQELIREAFKEWIFRDIDRREDLCRKYNELFNSIRPREYDGSHIQCVGMTPEITLMQHQKNAVAHILYGHNTLLAHCVGAGKTFQMIAAGMEKMCIRDSPYHVRLLLDEFANIGQIPKFDKLIATIRSREISASIILQSQSQLKTIYKDAAETILGNCDTMLFLGGKEGSTLKEISETLGKETIDLYNLSLIHI